MGWKPQKGTHRDENPFCLLYCKFNTSSSVLYNTTNGLILKTSYEKSDHSPTESLPFSGFDAACMGDMLEIIHFALLSPVRSSFFTIT